ncbi:hypothetical protein BDR06DRAFT_968454 [Suillus hirtellus]|nr:hypothetical protein BDR06DRAFT_968454 [Suillus hirtellus]
MTHFNNYCIHFDIPMNDESESHALLSTTGNNPNMMYFGFGALLVVPNTDMLAGLPAPPQQLNFGFESQPAKQLVICQTFDFGFNDSPAALKADKACTLPTVPYQLDFRFQPQQHMPLVVRLAFNFGFNTGIAVSPTPPPAAPLYFDFDWTTSNDLVTLVTQPFNFGMDLDVTPQRPATPPNISTPMPPALAPKLAFDFGWNLLLTSAPGPTVHVGYDISNKYNILIQLRSSSRESGRFAATSSLKNVLLSHSFPTSGPSVLTVISDAEKVVMNIVEQLQGNEFDQLAQLMIGSIVNLGDDVQYPNPDEVLDSNQVLLLVFCESRDKLTRIFKNLIHLHHMAVVQARVVPMMASLSKEVQKVEAQSSGSD